ncbi:MAG: efflux RND transporter periplasmic adaptor subunit [Rhodocyclaceae bacterium]|nr:efflux RND transporter periplasmic adaptor subunit [Rhodocyclaceae bacterium]
MKAFQRFLVPLVCIALGGIVGWWVATGGSKSAVPPAANKTQSTGKTSNGDTLDAPVGGFDPAFVTVAAVSREQVPNATPITGKLKFDAEHLHLVSSRVAGRLDRILVFEGAKVVKGQPLAELYSPDWIAAQNEFLLARNTVRTFASANQKDLLEDAKSTEEAARNRLRVLGAADEDIARVEKTGAVSTYMSLRASIDGVVTARNMDPGAFLNVGDNFMTVSDVSRVWFVGNIYEQDYAKVKLGQTLELTAPALPGQKFSGTVNYIGTTIDPVTHTLPVRCLVANPNGVLRPELFVNGSLLAGTQEAVVVPNAAVVNYRQAQFVIVETGPEQFRRQAVKAISLDDARKSVIEGLQGNERVVVEGSTLLNEAMSSR